MIFTSHSALANKEGATGVWLSSFTDAYYRFMDEGMEITLASPSGGQPPIDPVSEEEAYITETASLFRNDYLAQMEFGNTWRINEVDVFDYDAVYVADGHGGLWDLADDRIGRLVYQAYLEEKPIAMVGHGVAALSGFTALRPGALDGRALTGFTDTEEALLKRHHDVPHFTKDWLKQQGARFSQAVIPFTPHVERDRQFITGQNPASSGLVAEALVKILESQESGSALSAC